MDNPVVSVEHYENFPVASWLCPPRLRPPILAIYGFARTADDLADEGHASTEERLAALSSFRLELHTAAGAGELGPKWPEVFKPLRQAMCSHGLPLKLVEDLLDAFIQDASNPILADRAALLDYCRRSANPIGRLLLHLYRIDNPQALAESDAICSALQLINFWQDLSVDLGRGRHYLPQSELDARGLNRDTLRPGPATAEQRALVRDLCGWAQALMSTGTKLPHRLPGRVGWELRLVIQGGLRILEKIREQDHDSFAQRPTLQRMDGPRLLWRALSMKPT